MSDLQLHQRHGHLSSEAAVWRARHTTQTALWQWTTVWLHRVQDICSRLGIQAHHKLTQIPLFPTEPARLSRKPCSRQGRAVMIQTSLCCADTPPPSTTTSPPLPNSYTPGSSDPTSLSSPPTPPKIQLSTRTCKPASRRRRSTVTGAPVTFHHSTPASMSFCRKPTGPVHQPLLSRRGPNCVHTPYALQTVVSTVVIVTSSGT